MVNVTTYNITYLMNNPTCTDGMGCFFKNLNDISQGWLILSILFTTYIIATFILIQKGNATLKSFISSTYLMLFLVTISYLYDLINGTWTVGIIVVLASLTFVAIYSNR